MKKTFKIGGVHPHDNKISSAAATEIFPAIATAYVSMAQHLGAPATPVVAPGDKVKVGQVIAEPSGFISGYVHAPVSGTVKSVGPRADIAGNMVPHVEITVEGDEWMEDIDTSDKIVKDIPYTPEEIIDKVKKAGVVGLGGASFPTHVKLAPPKDKKAECLILNGTECEPYLTSDDRIMRERPEEILIGAAIMMKALGVDRGYVGIEENKPEAIATMTKTAAGFPGIEVVTLKKRYPQGLSPVGTVGMTVDEADSRQVAFEQIRETVAACRYLVRPSLSDAYFAAIEYPVYAAAAMNRKILSDAADSHRAYQEIQRLTAHYNRMNEGKWCGLMNAAPRNLPVFGDVRGRLLNDSIYVIIQRDASEYQEVTDGAETIQMLGHSMASLSLPQDGKVTYYFSVSEEGDYQLLISLIPTHAVDQGDVAFNVSIDGDKALRYSLKEPFRSERWKENVLCGQTVRKIPLHLQQGIHRLDLSSLTPHVVIDRWSLLKKNP